METRFSINSNSEHKFGHINIGGGCGQTWPRTNPKPWFPDQWPFDVPNTFKYSAVTSGYVALTPWRHKVYSESIDLWLDVPGVKVKDLSIEIDMGKLRVSGVRADTQLKIDHQYVLTDMYDPTTATASIEDGVLNINVKKRPENLPRKIKVEVR